MGTDRSGGRASDGFRLNAPPIGRVYGRRRGRKLKGKKAAALGENLEALTVSLPEPPAKLDPFVLFDPKPAKIWLEIGFGGGEHLAAQAAANPQAGLIGCEPFINGVSSLLVLLDENKERNVRVFSEDARLLLQSLPEGSIDRAFLLFPDPWPKRKHENRRFVHTEGLGLIAAALADDAQFRIATDHKALGEWMQAQVAAHQAFRLENMANARPDGWPPTRYEAKAIAAGRQPIYLTYRRNRRIETGKHPVSG